MASFLEQAVYGLEFTIHKGTDIDNPDENKTHWIYRAIVTDGSGNECCRALRCGGRDPIWNHSRRELYLYHPKFIELTVVEENCYGDPGTSTGAVVRGRAQIDLRRMVGFNRTQKLELVRPDGFKKKFGGFVYITVGMWKMQLWKVLDKAENCLSVQQLTKFLVDNAEDLGISTAKLTRVLTTSTNGLSLANLRDRIFNNSEFLSSNPINRKRRNQQARGAGFL